MEFKFSEEQQMIRATAEAFLSEVSSSAAVRAAMATERGYDPELWRRICAEMYWQATHTPEQFGGLGLGYVELVAMLEQMGRYLLCSPFFATVCLAANALLVAASEEQKAEYLPQLIEGRTATLAYTGRKGRWDAQAVEGTCERVGDQFFLNGCWRYVPDGHSADLLIIAAREPGSEAESGVSLFVVSAAATGIQREWLPTMDQTRKQAELRLENVVVDATQLLGEAGPALP